VNGETQTAVPLLQERKADAMFAIMLDFFLRNASSTRGKNAGEVLPKSRWIHFLGLFSLVVTSDPTIQNQFLNDSPIAGMDVSTFWY